jgi:hypothetical protein
MSTPLRPVLALIALAGTLAVWPLVQSAQAAPAPQPVDMKITVPEGNKLYLVSHAVGVQIYTCNGVSWGPSTPRADLFDERDNLIATHYGGPSWEARDGSKVTATKVDGVTMDSSAIQWLLLKKATATAGPDGDRFAGTTYIQRLNTEAGLPPAASDCTTEKAGTKQEVAYEADYFFWKRSA